MLVSSEIILHISPPGKGNAETNAFTCLGGRGTVPKDTKEAALLHTFVGRLLLRFGG